MRIKRNTELSFGYRATLRDRGRPEATFVVVGRFTVVPGGQVARAAARELPEFVPPAKLELGILAQPAPTGDVFAPSGALAHASDFADFKPRTDVMLVGTCHVPGGREARECTVGFGVGAWRKRLRVVGPRARVDRVLGGKKTEPLPFTRMPLDYAHAYGGPGYPVNPVGKGHEGDELPNVEPLHGDSSAETGPAGFAPVSPEWPQRATKRGKKYDAEWLEQRAPAYAVDFDYGHFNAAPFDQQLEGYLRGDEELGFENLHPEHATLKTRLPGLRLRVFIQHADGRQAARTLHLDTVFANLDEGIVDLTWRALAPVEEDDVSDVVAALVVEEPLADAPLADAHYLAELAAYARDPVGLEEAFPGGVEEAMRRADEFDVANEPDPVGVLASGKLGGLGGQQQAVLGDAIAQLEAAMPPGFDFRAMMKKALTEQRGKGAPVGGVGASGKPRVALAHVLKQVFDGLAPLRDQAERGGAGGAFAKLDAVANDVTLQQADPDLRGALRGAPPAEPGPGADLGGQDLSGRDLHGANLAGANLEAANLASANLSGANLKGAKLGFAILYKANLEAATLEGADLSNADLTLARARGANFTGATLDRVTMRRTDLAGAVLRGAAGAMTMFLDADLSRVDAEGVKLHKATFSGCALERASFRAAELEATLFRACKAPEASLAGASIAGASFMECAFTKADFSEARGRAASWLKANLEGADLSYSELPDAQLQEVVAGGAKFVAANLREARFYRAVLRAADFSQANLFGADLRKTVLTKTRFARANLYDAKLMESHGTDVDFRGAELARANFQRSEIVRA
jgi:uncharacterized protein YjbI with pentapeptide repeats